MIVPVLSGSGIRVKIIEGMALGKTIVTTTLGAAGIDCKDGEHILIANTPDEFIKKITLCIDSKETNKRIGENAKRLIEEKYSLTTTSAQLDSFLLAFK
jgi:glycosyltransferase involved in cell wall biosynthesis